jgi:hypothetical protein
MKEKTVSLLAKHWNPNDLGGEKNGGGMGKGQTNFVATDGNDWREEEEGGPTEDEHANHDGQRAGSPLLIQLLDHLATFLPNSTTQLLPLACIWPNNSSSPFQKANVGIGVHCILQIFSLIIYIPSFVFFACPFGVNSCG